MILHLDHFDSSRGLILRFIKYNMNVVYVFLVHIQINVHNNFCWLNIISCAVIIILSLSTSLISPITP